MLVFGLVVFRGAPYVPSRRKDITNAFTKLYALDDGDLLVDIGSGDGVVLRFATSQGARAVGFEINPLLAILSKVISWRDRRMTVKWADFWLEELPSDTTIVYAFSESMRIDKIAKKLQAESDRLGKTIFFMSYAFSIATKKPVSKTSTHFLYCFEPLLSEEA